MRVIAIIAAFNEADIIGPVIGDLADQGVLVYLIDHGSTDSTRSVAEQFAGRGLVGIEQFPPPGDPPSGTFAWTALLRRKEALGVELDAEWFIHHDADEFRESPWEGIRLVEAIERVDAAGYNAIDFEVVHFFPTDDTLCAGQDPRPVIRRCAPGGQFDKIQVKCWRKQASAVDLVSSGGHDVQFAGRRVFPLRFLTRHYPIRSQAHGDRKVFGERISRFDPAERALGWHVQYDDVRPGHDFLERARSLSDYSPDRVRLDLFLRHRGVEELELSLRERDALIGALTTEVAALGQRLQEVTGDLESVSIERDRLAAEMTALEVDAHKARETVERLERSRSWRWTAPLRWLASLIGLTPRGWKGD